MTSSVGSTWVDIKLRMAAFFYARGEEFAGYTYFLVVSRQ